MNQKIIPICPIANKERYPQLSEEDRLCEYPKTNEFFTANKHDGELCHQGGVCVVCRLYPDLAEQEYRAHNPIEEKGSRFVWFKPSCITG